jgi:hypothetical protein
MMRFDGTGRKQLTFPPDSLSISHAAQALQLRGDLHAWQR